MANHDIDRWKEYELFPSMFEDLTRAFPGMHFQKKGNRWESKYHLDGKEDSQKKAITIVYENTCFCAHDLARGEKPKELINLYAELNNLERMDAIRALAKLYNRPLPNIDSEEWKAQEQNRQGRERAKDAFIKALWSGTAEASKVLEYLHSRKWTDEEIKKAELGLITTEVRKSLPDGDKYKGVAKEKGTDRIIGGVGTTHLLAIHYKNGSRILGFKFREVLDQGQASTGTKYLNTYGLEKSTGFFGMNGQSEDITVVEGELDALHAQVKGGRNVVATTGNGATQGQIEDAIRRGVKRITLLFDNDERGKGFILPTLDKAEPTGAEVYVAFLPDGEGKDTDEYLASHTIQEWQKIVDDNAVPSYAYRYGEIEKKYYALSQEQGDSLNFKQRNDFLAEVEGILTAPYFKRQDAPLIYSYLETNAKALGVDVDELKAYVDKKYLREQAKSRRDETTKAAAEISALLNQGKVDEALKLMRDTANKQSIQEKAVEFEKVFAPMNPQQISTFLSEIKDGIPTGFKFSQGNQSEELTLNSGLTFICGYRGHCKTTFLNNIALNEAKRNVELGNGKSVLYFSYEVDKRRLITDLLNTFVNDPEMSRKPSDTILSYYKGKGAEYFKGQSTGHSYKEFIRKQEIFLSKYLNGSLVIVEENYKVEELLRAIKWYMTTHNVAMVCIDYAQLIYSEDYTRQRTEEIKKVVNDIKDFANKEGIPFVMAAQFNREVDSPISVDTKNIGEGGDFERIADTCIGLYNLKELRPLPKNKEEEKEAKKLLESLGVHTYQQGESLKGIDGKLFVRLMKRRYGYFPLDTILDWEGRTKYIKPNFPEALEVKAETGDLFKQNNEPLPF